VFRNRVVTDVFEPGSTLKPFTAAAALESGKFLPHTMIDTGPGLFTVGRNTIRDTHHNGPLTVAQVIEKSSNIGAARIALALGDRGLREMFSKAGFGAITGISLCRLNWRRSATATASR
jgi:cell division protein FtsI (penicillin-binding protein 3)